MRKLAIIILTLCSLCAIGQKPTCFMDVPMNLDGSLFRSKIQNKGLRFIDRNVVDTEYSYQYKGTVNGVDDCSVLVFENRDTKEIGAVMCLVASSDTLAAILNCGKFYKALTNKYGKFSSIYGDDKIIPKFSIHNIVTWFDKDRICMRYEEDIDKSDFGPNAKYILRITYYTDRTHIKEDN